MNDDRISVIEAAQTVGYRKQAVFKILSRLGIEIFKERSADHKGQAIAYIAFDDFQLLQRHVATRKDTANIDSDVDGEPLGIDYGVFYLIQLEPDHDPGRFKVGFAVNVSERLRSHKCSAPFAQVVKTWPCKRLWEKTAIDCVASGCDQIHTEVFRTDDLAAVIAKCDKFFTIMPNLANSENSDRELSVEYEAADDAV